VDRRDNRLKKMNFELSAALVRRQAVGWARLEGLAQLWEAE
jgi:hypothetical protein